MFYTIYKTINLLNGKFYIGKHQTKDLADNYLGSGKLLKRAISKYGRENFSKEILYIFDNEADMNAKEKKLVILCEDSYNLCEGGKGGFGYINNNRLNLYPGKSKNDSINLIKANIGARKYFESGKHSNLLKTIMPKWFKENYPNGTFVGKKHSYETKLKMSLSHQGKHNGSRNSQYGTIWITNGSSNKKIKKEELDNWVQMGYTKGRK